MTPEQLQYACDLANQSEDRFDKAAPQCKVGKLCPETGRCIPKSHNCGGAKSALIAGAGVLAGVGVLGVAGIALHSQKKKGQAAEAENKQRSKESQERKLSQLNEEGRVAVERSKEKESNNQFQAALKAKSEAKTVAAQAKAREELETKRKAEAKTKRGETMQRQERNQDLNRLIRELAEYDQNPAENAESQNYVNRLKERIKALR